MYITVYYSLMKLTITEFRKNLFKLVERVIAGETIEFVHRGTTVRLVVPEGAAVSKLDRLTARPITNPRTNDKAEKKMQRDMWAEIEKDWAAI